MGSLRLQAERTGGSGTWQLGIHVSFSLALLVFRCERSKLPRGGRRYVRELRPTIWGQDDAAVWDPGISAHVIHGAVRRGLRLISSRHEEPGGVT